MGNDPDKRIFAGRETDIPAASLLRQLKNEGEFVAFVGGLSDVPVVKKRSCYTIVSVPGLTAPLKLKDGGYIAINPASSINTADVIELVEQQTALAATG